MNNITNQENIMSEPEVAYGKKRKWTFKKFNSFEEMENDQLEYFASLTPEELFRNLKQLNMAAYCISDESKLSKLERKIQFK